MVKTIEEITSARRQKTILLFFILVLLVLITFITMKLIKENDVRTYNMIVEYVPFVAAVVGVILSFNYLTVNDTKLRTDKSFELLDLELNELTKEIDEMKINLVLSELEKKDIKEEVIQNMSKNLSQDAIDEILNKRIDELSENIKVKSHFEIHDISSGLRYRLSDELERLKRNSNLNLMIGIVITTLGISLLFFTINNYNYTLEDGKSIIDVFIPLIPRFFLVLFIELFAYFFLRLYKTNLNEIKYMQNELTNIEAKIIALEVSNMIGDRERLGEVLSILANTERNFIIKKDETTLEIEKMKHDNTDNKNILDALNELLKKK